MHRLLLSDSTFQTLNIPLSPALRREMDNKIRKGEPVQPIQTWRGIIVTGYEQNDICLKYHRNAATTELNFPRKPDAVAWLCHEQLKRTDLFWAAKAWLISRLYEALREIAHRQAAKSEFEYRQLSQTLYADSYSRRPQKESVPLLKQIGTDYNYHKDTIRRYVQFGRQLDKLEFLVPGTRVRILTGELRITIHNETNHISALPRPKQEFVPFRCHNH